MLCKLSTICNAHYAGRGLAWPLYCVLWLGAVWRLLWTSCISQFITQRGCYSRTNTRWRTSSMTFSHAWFSFVLSKMHYAWFLCAKLKLVWQTVWEKLSFGNIHFWSYHEIPFEQYSVALNVSIIYHFSGRSYQSCDNHSREMPRTQLLLPDYYRVFTFYPHVH